MKFNVIKDVIIYNEVTMFTKTFASLINYDVFITDTYPDKWRQCQLYVADVESQFVRKILSINSPKKFLSKTVYNYTDCDLHPRVSHSGKYVCCDVVYTGKRGLFVMTLDKNVEAC